MMRAEKQDELNRYRSLVFAAIDYQSNLYDFQNPKYAPLVPYHEQLKLLAEQHHQRGRLSTLKQWFRDLSEMPREAGDLSFNTYIKDKTGYDIDIFRTFHKRIDKIIERKRINTANEYRDVLSMVDHLCQEITVNDEKINILNNLMSDFDNRINSKDQSFKQ